MGVDIRMKTKKCERCKKMIDLNKDLHASLGTHEGKKTLQIVYFHFNCWRLHFEEKTRKKAEVIVKDMQERITPMAKQLMNKFIN